ncbi:MAG: DASS family sodium-coupled anion symporter [Pseudomonadota bacterium]|nr:DASS family sodium-coupled anion symporter [Pseudomonadota bacterium]
MKWFKMNIGRKHVAWAGLLLGPALALAAAALLPEATGRDQTGLTPAGLATAAVAIWMATWWLTEAVPIAATALLPVVLFPLLGIADIKVSAAPYANPLIFLFLGGFLLGLGIQRFGLHRRIALHVLLRVGPSPRALIAGFMLTAALLSMWISNSATAVMMLPIGASVLKLLEDHRSKGQGASCTPAQMRAFGTALVLGIAYACSIGGTGTLVGTPPNLVLAAFVKEHYGSDVSMVGWLGIGLPLIAVLLPITWWYLTRVAFRVPATPFPCGRAVLESELASLGTMSRGERVTLVVFALTALAWLVRPQLVSWTGIGGITDAGIAMCGALSLFVIPVGWKARRFAMDWETAKQAPWEILILFGGGLSLAAAIDANAVDSFIASGFAGLGGVPSWVLVLAIASVVVFLTEITSNTAVTTTLMPVLAATAIATNSPPGMLLTAAALAASCAFMLPVATPPNAIVFSSGYVTIPQMARAGLGLNILAILVVTIVVSLGSRLVLT